MAEECLTYNNMDIKLPCRLKVFSRVRLFSRVSDNGAKRQWGSRTLAHTIAYPRTQAGE
jgi:hypothetical protein